jgi:hypothetical protein
MSAVEAFVGSAKKPRRNDEEQLQRGIVAYLGYAARKDAIWFHVPNGEGRSKAAGGRLKAMGVRPGVADLCFVLKDGHAAFMELKAVGGKQSANQLVFEQRCIDCGVPYVVVTSMGGAIEILKAWGVVR